MFIKRIWDGVDAIFYTDTSCSLKNKKKKHYFAGKFDRALDQAHLVSQTVNFDWLKRLAYPLIAAILIVSFISVPNIMQASQPKHEEPDKCCECCGQCCCECGCDCAGAGCGC